MWSANVKIGQVCSNVHLVAELCANGAPQPHFAAIANEIHAGAQRRKKTDAAPTTNLQTVYRGWPRRLNQPTRLSRILHVLLHYSYDWNANYTSNITQIETRHCPEWSVWRATSSRRILFRCTVRHVFALFSFVRFRRSSCLRLIKRMHDLHAIARCTRLLMWNHFDWTGSGNLYLINHNWLESISLFMTRWLLWSVYFIQHQIAYAN